MKDYFTIQFIAQIVIQFGIHFALLLVWFLEKIGRGLK